VLDGDGAAAYVDVAGTPETLAYSLARALVDTGNAADDGVAARVRRRRHECRRQCGVRQYDGRRHLHRRLARCRGDEPRASPNARSLSHAVAHVSSSEQLAPTS